MKAKDVKEEYRALVRKGYPEAAELLDYMHDPKVINECRKNLRALPAWKTQFLSGYDLESLVSESQRRTRLRGH